MIANEDDITANTVSIFENESSLNVKYKIKK